MKKIILIALALAATAVTFNAAYAVTPEIHCKHFFYGYPTGTPVTNDLIIRDIYALSSNDETKFADWVAYRLDAATVTGDVETTRKWKADPWLAPEETLEPRPDDYRGAHEALGTDRGHQAPLASFKGTAYWAETNYYSNITPQDSDLNQGPWRVLEDNVRDLARAGVEDFTFHDLRHTFASWLAMKGVPLSTIGNLLGHRTTQMTMRYAHFSPAYLSEAVEKIT